MSILQAHLACFMIFFARRYRKRPIFHRPLWFTSEMDRFRYVSAVNRKWKFVWWVEFRSICDLSYHTTPVIFYHCFYFGLVNFSWTSRARCIFEFKISGTITSKPILALGFSQWFFTITVIKLFPSLHCVFTFSEVIKWNVTKMIFWNLHFKSIQNNE